MTFPDDELNIRETTLLDTNPTFGRLMWPLLEFMIITGIYWLLIGLIDSPAIAPGDLRGARQLLPFAWLGSIFRHAVRPVLGWLGKQFVLTDRWIILYHGTLHPQMVSVDLCLVHAVNRKGGMLYPQTRSPGPPLAVEGISSSRKVAKLVSRLI